MDNEQNKRSEEKQKTQPFPCVGEGFVSVLLSCEKNGGRIFPRSPPRHAASLLSSPPFPSLLPRGCARVCPSFSRVYQKGRERATKGGEKLREGTTTTTMDMAGVVASGGEVDQYFCTQAPSGSGPWHRGILAPSLPRSSLTLTFDIVRTYTFI